MDCTARCRLPASVNRDLLPLKAHFFLYVAAQACVYPYLAVVGRQNGISASTIAIIFGFTPLAAVVIKPVCGYIIDRTQNATAVILALQLILIASTGVVFFSPSVKYETWHTDGLLDCSRGTFTVFDTRPEVCFGTSRNISATIQCNVTLSGKDVIQTGIEDFAGSVISLVNASSTCSVLEGHGSIPAGGNATGRLSCPCEGAPENEGNFWLYTVSVVIAWAVSATLYTASDAAVCEVLGDNVKAFGRQRLWGTIGWGIVSPIIGFSIDEASIGGDGRTDYRPGFYVFASLALLNMILIACMPRLRTADLSVNFFKDLTSLFCDLQVVTFTFWTFAIGAFMGVLWSFSTWFLEDMGASKLMIGLANSVMSLVVELPLFFMSSSILERLGYFLSYSTTFILFSVKFIAYSFLRNPWYGLIIEIVGGAIFPIAYAAMTVFAKVVAKPGTSASMMCCLGATFEGLGVAAGNLLGGMCFDNIGGRLTFRYLGYASLACAVCSAASYMSIRSRKSRLPGSERSVLTFTNGKSGNGSIHGEVNLDIAERSYL